MDYIIKKLTKEDLENDLDGFLLTLSNLKETKEINLNDTIELLEKINSQ
jgi:response regulator of citrate/malate metabolism